MAEQSVDRLRRLLTLVPWLAAHSGITKAEAAAHFGITQRQLESDLELVTVTGPGVYGGELVDIAFEDETITVVDAQGLLLPLQLTPDESAALLLGLRALQQLPDVDAALVAGLMEKLAIPTDDDILVEVSPGPYATVIASAISARCDLEITYAHPVRDAVTERRVTPREIVTRDGVDYLNAWCHTAGAVRTFRLDRMRSCVAGAPSDIDARPRSEGVRVPPERARLLVDPAHAFLLEEVTAAVVGTSGDLLEVEFRYADEDWLVAWLVNAGAAVRCAEPERVMERVRARAVEALSAYE